MRASPRPSATPIALALLGLLALAAPPAEASLIHDYAFQGNLKDSLGGPDLTSLGGSVGPSSYTFGPQQGLALSGGLVGAQASVYTIDLVFSLDDLNGYRKLIDFKARSSDAGLYNLSTDLNFFNDAFGPNGAFATGVSAQVDLTRAASGLVVGYVNGVQQFSFTDAANEAVFNATNNIINFFQDDAVTSGRETPSGSVSRIRIFDTALSAPEVSTLSTVPEPPGLSLVASGLALAGLASRRLAARRRAR